MAQSSSDMPSEASGSWSTYVGKGKNNKDKGTRDSDPEDQLGKKGKGTGRETRQYYDSFKGKGQRSKDGKHGKAGKHTLAELGEHDAKGTCPPSFGCLMAGSHWEHSGGHWEHSGRWEWQDAAWHWVPEGWSFLQDSRWISDDEAEVSKGKGKSKGKHNDDVAWVV